MSSKQTKFYNGGLGGGSGHKVPLLAEELLITVVGWLSFFKGVNSGWSACTKAGHTPRRIWAAQIGGLKKQNKIGGMCGSGKEIGW